MSLGIHLGGGGGGPIALLKEFGGGRLGGSFGCLVDTLYGSEIPPIYILRVTLSFNNQVRGKSC